jgi:hypothetical protein
LIEGFFGLVKHLEIDVGMRKFRRGPHV